MPVDTKLNSLIINELTSEQYNELVEQDKVNENELYLTTDQNYPTGSFVTADNKTVTVTNGVITAITENM